jgi:hypothetical protein
MQDEKARLKKPFAERNFGWANLQGIGIKNGRTRARKTNFDLNQ